jgi:mono/diheme cytochrome c family protein
MADTPERFTLRQLPLPAKLVISVFLISVGAGYLAAMVQLHYKQASPGNFAPGLGDVVARFSGVPWPPVEGGNGHDAKPEGKANGAPANPVAKDGKPAAGLAQATSIRIQTLITRRCGACHGKEGEQEEHPLDAYDALSKYLKPKPELSQIHKLITAEPDVKWGKDTSMRNGFTTMHPEWKADVEARMEKLAIDDEKEAKDKAVEQLKAERETERLILIAWLKAGAPKGAYEADSFPLPRDLVGKPLDEELKPQPAGLAHGKANGPAAEAKRKAKSRQISVESLTQSTHAHLLSFAMLWALTGLTFAFTSYPLWARATLAPIVLLAQLIDVACWWLARLPDVGPYFALAVIGTGAVVGVGLVLQIVLSLFNMYSGKGKAVLVLLFALAGGAAYLTFEKYIQPEVTAEAEAAQPQK